ncbi:branched-chain amino acid ABC transporter substrate-binding protein [Limibaculum sp. FT325]|uniref:branched-chain amino acid ABC transporter substrate-binding protein n=1 Tax=Thermohalobaculum sediminis TaxID=2939436 RepID=UPI0020C0417C|nr:branched-chain amino acid ABC transporter substrate-binding protein [Limibaculum sediminis]MCL5776893.1 branched-chain amino acid ABC transporter substrate-binding protein [Limibaculum sediminis]
MIARLAVLAIALVLALPALAAEPARIVYLGVVDDPAYQPQRVYTGLALKDRHRPVDGARLAVAGTKALARALGIGFVLDERLLAAGGDAAAEVRAARASGALAVLLDLPEQAMAAVLAAEGGEGLLVNIRHVDDRWRGADCAPALLHAMPSRSMLTDALAQHLRFRGWTRVLVLRGPGPENEAEAAAIRRSIGKFGLDLADERAFELTNDPRQRDLGNVALLTGDARYDVIWLADAEGEFGRYVPFATYLPRPVVGSEGLTPVAWHWTLERYGAPQLNQRFRRAAGRDMAAGDWAAWVAVRSIIEAVSQRRTVDRAGIAELVRSGDLALDLYKGVRGSFRPWDGQLRQPILLATHNAVIAIAPFDGFQHQTDTLDTLGIDRPETACRR